MAMTAAMRFVVLHGPEDMLRREKLRELQAALEAEHGEVTRFDLDGTRASLSDVMDEVRSYSLMGGYKLVVVDQAMGGGGGGGGGASGSDAAKGFVSEHRAALERYAEHPVDHATLVLRCETWRPGKLDKAVAKVGAVIKCEAMREPAAAAWAVARAAEVHGVAIDKKAADLLVRRAGTQLTPLDTELAKLAAMAGGQGADTISEDLVASAVEKSSDEKAWEVQSGLLEALGKRKPGAAIEKLHELIDVGGQPDILVMYFVVDLARKFVVAAQMRRGGANDAEIGKALKLWGAGASAFFRVAGMYDEPAALRLFNAAQAMDARSKSGLGTARRNLEGFCVGLTVS